ncbi:MAG: NYN domain-containing protein [Candidatus Promineifilaceae bacterium]|nr:NYN domain-containing protein [Candidatus Promineifilaceae bacterium]
MTNDVAIFLDLDNLVIGAKQANVPFDINLLLDHIREITNGRIVLRNAYGAGRQSQSLLQELAHAGFVVQSATRINSYSKNLADMQIAVNAMDTLVDGHQYHTYVLMSGDRDFTPLVQSLRKRGKCVIGIGVQHTTSGSLMELCDHYIFYEELIAKSRLSEEETEQLLIQARDLALKDKKRVRASVFKQCMIDLSEGRFGKTSYPESSFRNFLQQYPHLIQLKQERSTIYITSPVQDEPSKPLHVLYRRALKKQRLRIVPVPERLTILKDLIALLNQQSDLLWRNVLGSLSSKYKDSDQQKISKNMVNSVMLLSREAGIIKTLKGKSLSTAPVLLAQNGERSFQDAIIRSDRTYLRAILNLSEPFDLREAALALYDDEKFVPYLQRIMQSLTVTDSD